LARRNALHRTQEQDACMNLTDEALVASYLEDDDQNAFRILVERHQERVFGYLMGMVRNRELADDLFQETFLRVIAALRRERGSYERQGRWLAWVIRIARNTALDHLRRRKKWRDVDNADGEESYWDQVPDDVPVADERLDSRQQAARLEACIARLPQEQQEVVMLRHDAELTFREIAEMTGVSINTALGRMRYALINLRKMMVVAAEQDIKTA
jgi:RNA polymerase sigma-70 factor (ECF subfamily)